MPTCEQNLVTAELSKLIYFDGVAVESAPSRSNFNRR
jgi:hypothetical protein